MKKTLALGAIVAGLLSGSGVNAMPLPPVPQNVYHFCLNRGSTTWAYNNPSSRLAPLSISPFVDLAGYSMEVGPPRRLTIHVRIASGGTSGSIAPFHVAYEDLSPDLGNIVMHLQVTEAQVAQFSQALSSISFNDTHMAMGFTLKDSVKPLSEGNIVNMSFNRQTDSTGCANFPPALQQESGKSKP